MQFIELKAKESGCPPLRIYVHGNESGYRERVALAHALLFKNGDIPDSGMASNVINMSAKVKAKAVYDPYRDSWSTNIFNHGSKKVWLEATASLDGIAARGYEFFDIREED